MSEQVTYIAKRKEYADKFSRRIFVSEEELLRMSMDYMNEIANPRKKVVESIYEHDTVQMEPLQSIQS